MAQVQESELLKRNGAPFCFGTCLKSRAAPALARPGM
jgi:hypothetical protein